MAFRFFPPPPSSEASAGNAATSLIVFLFSFSFRFLSSSSSSNVWEVALLVGCGRSVGSIFFFFFWLRCRLHIFLLYPGGAREGDGGRDGRPTPFCHLKNAKMGRILVGKKTISSSFSCSGNKFEPHCRNKLSMLC